MKLLALTVLLAVMQATAPNWLFNLLLVVVGFLQVFLVGVLQGAKSGSSGKKFAA